jgi:hypothetical protein
VCVKLNIIRKNSLELSSIGEKKISDKVCGGKESSVFTVAARYKNLICRTYFLAASDDS